jgi:hypothetical protein
MHMLDQNDEPRWTGYVRLGAAGVFAVVVALTAVVDVMLITDKEPVVAAAVVANTHAHGATVQR